MFASSVPIIEDHKLAELVGMPEAIDLMEEAFNLHFQQKLLSPPRLEADLTQSRLAFTCGAIQDENPQVGFRVYDWLQLGSEKRSEMTPLFSAVDGSLKGICLGPFLGAWRTGAIGGVALKYLANSESAQLALIGTGYQARTQLLAACEVLPLKQVRIYSRNRANAEQFIREMEPQLETSPASQIEMIVSNSISAAVRQADVVICATKSSQPLLELDWLTEHVHLQNVGPKFKNEHEIGLTEISACKTLVTDSLSQAFAYPTLLLAETNELNRLQDLSSLITQTDSMDMNEQETITNSRSYFCSLGLAGSELLLVRAAVERLKQQS